MYSEQRELFVARRLVNSPLGSIISTDCIESNDLISGVLFPPGVFAQHLENVKHNDTGHFFVSLHNKEQTSN